VKVASPDGKKPFGGRREVDYVSHVETIAMMTRAGTGKA